MKNLHLRRVVVTGIGALTPIGNTIAAYKEGLMQGKSGCGLITRFDASLFRTKFACELKGFNVEDYMHKREARRMDPFSQYAMVVTDEAIVNAGLDTDKIDLERAGVVWGSGIGGFETIERDIEEATLREGEPKYSPFLIPKLIADIAPGHISIKYGFQGPNYTTVSACASSSNAICSAYDYIRYGKAEIMITGGSEAAITKAGVGGFSSMKALSERNNDPATASRPFDKNRDGFVLGEGAGALVLEEYEHARKRGAHILCEIVGSGLTADAYHMTAPHPEGTGVMRVMNLALAEAGIDPGQVDYINTHATSTPLGDVAEILAIKHLFGENNSRINISATKSMTGHLLGAAGAIELISGIIGMQYDFVPPTINHFEEDPDIGTKLNLTLNEAQHKKLDVVLSNTFGFGGHNSSIIIKKI
ncbi:MAG TPA: beta-ketoacyl-ACP synthase II [Saprospiraceae bacterium]|nr:beta-ketoacyl-ACP synthase II [Saprospiraceae bacterium]